MRYIRTNSFKRLFSFKKRGLGEQELNSKDEEKDNSLKILPYEEESCQRPTWKCFSYEELFEATNGFISGIN
jgi:hypothetical protein